MHIFRKGKCLKYLSKLLPQEEMKQIQSKTGNKKIRTNEIKQKTDE